MLRNAPLQVVETAERQPKIWRLCFVTNGRTDFVRACVVESTERDMSQYGNATQCPATGLFS